MFYGLFGWSQKAFSRSWSIFDGCHFYCSFSSRFRCVVPYPPNSEVELELQVGDIIFVYRKQKNGWYKGTNSRTYKTGLFPASFVEPDL